jgi:hypothetical protein
MNIWHVVYRVDSLTYTVAKALTHGGHHVCVWVVQPDQDYGLSEGIYRALRDTPGVDFIGREEARLPDEIERLVIQTHPRPMETTRDASLLACRSKAITLISAGDRNRPLRTAIELQWLELRRLWRRLGALDRVLYKDGYHAGDLLGLLKSRSILGFDVHSQFLHNERLFAIMHAADWAPEAKRPMLVNFMGCRDPEMRTRILDSVRALFDRSDGLESARFVKPSCWHEYSNASPIGLDPVEFVRILSLCDFTLCPRGYSLVTHRPVEALLRGSIPVLSAAEIDLYGFPLRHGENCIAVKDQRWADSILELERWPESELVRMRNNVRAMFEPYLSYDATARQLRSRLGVADEASAPLQRVTRPGAAVAS